MFEALDDFKRYGSITLLIASIAMIFMSGIYFGILYWTMETTETAFEDMDCVIENNAYVGSCQELWELSVYPFLGMRDILIWFSFFFIFALTLGMLVVGYQSGKSPVLLGALILFLVIFTYFGIEISNIYRTMLENEMFRSMMTSFTVYNKIMLNFPWFTFIVGLFSIMLSVVNYQKTRVNSTREELNY